MKRPSGQSAADPRGGLPSAHGFTTGEGHAVPWRRSRQVYRALLEASDAQGITLRENDTRHMVKPAPTIRLSPATPPPLVCPHAEATGVWWASLVFKNHGTASIRRGGGSDSHPSSPPV